MTTVRRESWQIVEHSGGTDTSVGIAVNSAEFALTPPLGLMVITLDNQSGPNEAQLIQVKPKK